MLDPPLLRASAAVRQSPTLTRLAGLTVTLLGIMVLVSWRAHWTALLQIFPNSAAIKYNTGLCFILFSIGGASQRIQAGIIFHFELAQSRQPLQLAQAAQPADSARCKVLTYRNDPRLASERTDTALILHANDDTDLCPVIEAALAGRPEVGNSAPFADGAEALERSISCVVGI
jgi:hypothetical protein